MEYRKKAVDLTRRAVLEGVEPGKILNETRIPAMDIVGEEYERADRYVPKMLILAVAMQGGDGDPAAEARRGRREVLR